LEPKDVVFWENVERGFEELEEDFKLSRGGLNELLARIGGVD
jgi:hypothetical protein